MQSPSNPFQSFTWLSEFIATVSDIISQNHVGFECEPFVAQPISVRGISHVKGKRDAAGDYTNGMYWLGFYYKLWKAENPNRALPWFGCQFVNEFTIDIIVHPIADKYAGADNHGLHDYLFLNEYAGGNVPHQEPIIHGTVQEPFCCQSNSRPDILLRYRFDDYMKNVKGESNFRLSNWICSSSTQKDDLRKFFETVNANHLAPHI